MKNTSLILSTISLVAVVVFGVLFLTKDGKKAEVSAANGENTEAVAQKGDIVYVDLDKILMDYDMANDLRAVVETKVQNIQAEVTRRGKKLEKEIATWQEKLNKGLMTRSVAEAQQAKLQKQQEEFAQYAAQQEQIVQEEQGIQKGLIISEAWHGSYTWTLEKLQQIRSREGAVLFVGDGINDAPVLAGADVGAAMGSGADAAIEAADVVFLHTEVQAIPNALQIARKTKQIAWQNIVFALSVKLLVMVLGLLGNASMWAAVFADSGVAMLCVLNSIRLLYRKKK